MVAGACHRAPDHLHLSGFGQTRFDHAAALTVVQFLLLIVLTVFANRLSGGNAGSLERRAMRPTPPPAPRHHDRGVIPDADPVLLGAEDVAHRREHLCLSAAPRAGQAASLQHVDVWYLIPFPRYLLNSVIVSTMAIAGSLLFNVAAGYALTKDFPARRWVVLLLLSCMLIPFQATIIPAYLITSWLGVLDTWLGIALPLLSTIICIFIFGELRGRAAR